MRANLPAKKHKHTSPTQTRLSFEGSGGATQYIDIAMAMSAINRVALRQGLYYYVNSVEIYNNETGVIDLHVLPDTWTTKNAHNRARTLWNKNMTMVGPPLTAGLMPKYHDFKVTMNDRHRTTGSMNPSLHGLNGASGSEHLAVTADDWEYSRFVSADDDGDVLQDADKFKIHMLGPHVGTSDDWTSIGAIASYANTRTTVPDESPELTSSEVTNIKADPLLNVFDMSSEEQLNEIIEVLADDNDNPPYDHDLYTGESENTLQHVARLGPETGVGRIARAAGFCAPFGLLCIDPMTGITSGWRVVLNLAQGSYHGIYAERV